MYAYIRGPIKQLTQNYAIVETQGIGYKIHISTNTSFKLALDTEVLFYTSFVIREFSQQLIGFLEEGERDLFEVLLDISGVGVKIALSLIGHLPLPKLCDAVIRDDLQSLIKIPGIGKKTAERLMVELRDKIPQFSHQFRLAVEPKTHLLQDGVKALMHLGYSSTTAQKAIKKALDQTDSLELPELISSALRHV